LPIFQGVIYQCIDEEEKLNAVINVLKDVSVCSIDLETSGLSVYDDYIVGIGLSWQEGTGVYIPVNHEKGKNIDYDKALELLKPCLENENICYVAHNRKFDQTLLGASYLVDDFIKNNPNYATDLWLSVFHKEMGIQWQPTLFKKLGINCFVKFDTMAMAYLTGRYMNIGTGSSTASLKKIVLSELGIQMVQIEQLFGVDPDKKSSGKKAKAKKANLIRFETLDPREEIPLPGGDLVSPYQYGCADCDMTLRLFNKLYPQVKDMFLLKVDQGIIPLVKLMELNGVLCDIEEMKRQYKALTSENVKLQTLIYEFVSDKVGAKITFDLGSSAQVGRILFERLGYPVQERSAKTGKPSTNATVLEAMAKDYPIVKNILYWRSIRKHAEDFFNGMQEYINNITNRIHTSYATAHVISGRFASYDPNMQNQPKKASWEIYNPYGEDYEISCNVRKCYVPPKDFYVLEGDFSQVEYRVFAGRSQSRALLEGYRHGVDMHTKNASMIFQVPEAQVTKKLRSDGKTFSFGIMYGMRAMGISKRIGIPKAECQKYVNNYFQAIPEGVQHIKDITDGAKRNCYVVTHFGRIAHMPEFRSDNSKLRFKAEREAFNITIQGTAADIMRIAMYRLGQTLLKDFGPRFNDVIKPILTTHDSFAFYIHRSVDVVKLMAAMRKACEIPITNFPHIKMDFQVGPSYGELLDWGEGIEKSFDTGKADFGFGEFFADKGSKDIPDKNPEEDKKVDLNVISDENKVINKSPVILRVVIPKELNPVEASAIKNLIAAYPGQNKIIIDFPGAEVSINRTTSLGLDDESKFQMICTCKLTLDSKSISGKALTTGLKL
jgi:DNA polymerase I